MNYFIATYDATGSLPPEVIPLELGRMTLKEAENYWPKSVITSVSRQRWFEVYSLSL